jgi:hypothetical protein
MLKSWSRQILILKYYKWKQKQILFPRDNFYYLISSWDSLNKLSDEQKTFKRHSLIQK